MKISNYGGAYMDTYPVQDRAMVLYVTIAI